MALRRKYMKKSYTRPRKGGAAKKRRQLEQKRRLVALGMDEAVVEGMSAREVLTKLKYPKKVLQETQGK